MIKFCCIVSEEEGFGLVIVEALERGKRVIATGGTPAWGEDCECKMGSVKCKRGDEGKGKREEGGICSGYGGRLVYLKGYRDGSTEERVRLLKSAITNLRQS